MDWLYKIVVYLLTDGFTRLMLGIALVMLLRVVCSRLIIGSIARARHG